MRPVLVKIKEVFSGRCIVRNAMGLIQADWV